MKRKADRFAIPILFVVLVVVLLWGLWFLIFGVDWSAHRSRVSYEQMNDGIYCFVWDGNAINCQTPTP